MRRRDFFRSCMAAAGVCALPAPVASVGCLTITAIDFYAGTITLGSGPAIGHIKADDYAFKAGDVTHFEVGMPLRFNIEELT